METWLLTGPPGRVLSFSADLALAMPLLLAHGARRAWGRLSAGRTDVGHPDGGPPSTSPEDDQSSPAA